MVEREYCAGVVPSTDRAELANGNRDGGPGRSRGDCRCVGPGSGPPCGRTGRWFGMDRIHRQDAQTRRLKQQRAILKRDDALRESRVAEIGGLAGEINSPRGHREHWRDRASALQRQLMDATGDLAGRSKRRQVGGERAHVKRVVEDHQERGLALQPVRIHAMPPIRASSELSSRRLRSVGGKWLRSQK